MIRFELILVFVFVLTSCTEAQRNERVPAWAKEAIWYQIFPERFNNGDKTNDPSARDIEGVWPYDIPEGWRVHPWNSDWYELQPWEKETNHDFYWNAGVRRYGGDLQGVIDKLDYLSDLGINAIYFNPVFASRSLHKYDTENYRHIDKNFGPDPSGDLQIWNEEDPLNPKTWQWTSADKLFLKLLKEAHKRNIKVIIDGVFNHVGNMFWAFQDVIKNQEKSDYKDWFYITSFDDPSTSENEFDYEGWYGVRDLPEIREDENGLVNGPKQHIFNIVKRWMDPNGDGNPEDGIDGWRLDVAEMVKHEFWIEFRKVVKDINPDAYIVGEIWWDDWNQNKMFNASPWLAGDQFDAVMNYRFTRALKRFVSDNKLGIGPHGFVDSLNNQYREYHKENLYVLMNLLGSHDTERLSSFIVNPDIWYDHGAVPKDTKDWDVRAPNNIEREKQKLIVALQMVLPGAPHIYYGEEAGMWGGDDPDCRKPMVWPGIEYDEEKAHPFGHQRQINDVSFNQDLFNFYKKMISIRKQNPCLSLGDISFKVLGENENILTFQRMLNQELLTVVVNNNPNETSLKLDETINVNANNEYLDLMSNKKLTEKIINLKPYSIGIIKEL